MADPLRLNIEPPQHGWAAVSLASGGNKARFLTSYVYDSIGRLAGAVSRRVVHPHPAGAAVPDYTTRGQRFIEWAADSSSVTVPVARGRRLVLAVP